MQKSQRIALRDVRSIHRLVAECCDLWADPIAWHAHWYEGACRLVGAIGAMGGEVLGFFDDPRQRILQFQYSGFDDVARRRHLEYMGQAGYRTIDHPLCAMRGTRRRVLTRSHEQLIERRRWRRSELFNDYFRPTHIDDRMLSVSCFPLDGSELPLYDMITLYRGVGERPFSARDRGIVHLLQRELRAVTGTRLATSLHRNTYGLSRRLRQVLDGLLRGESEKAIALRLRLSPATVNQYVGMLYEHFDVHSRRELMAYFVRRQPAWRRPTPGSD